MTPYRDLARRLLRTAIRNGKYRAVRKHTMPPRLPILDALEKPKEKKEDSDLMRRRKLKLMLSDEELMSTYYQDWCKLGRYVKPDFSVYVWQRLREERRL